MEEQLSLDFLRVVENAAIAAARTMGYGDRHHADEVAVEAMRKTMDSVEIDGTIVIGEGERDDLGEVPQRLRDGLVGVLEIVRLAGRHEQRNVCRSRGVLRRV